MYRGYVQSTVEIHYAWKETRCKVYARVDRGGDWKEEIQAMSQSNSNWNDFIVLQRLQGVSPELSTSETWKLDPFGFLGNLVGGLPLFWAFSLWIIQSAKGHTAISVIAHHALVCLCRLKLSRRLLLNIVPQSGQNPVCARVSSIRSLFSRVVMTCAWS